MIQIAQGVTKICRLSWLTKSTLVYEPKCGGVAGYQSMSTAVHMEPKYSKLRRSNSIFNIWDRRSWLYLKVKIIWLPWSLEANISWSCIQLFNAVRTCLKASTKGRQVYCVLENMALCCLCLSTVHLHSLARGEPFIMYLWRECIIVA